MRLSRHFGTRCSIAADRTDSMMKAIFSLAVCLALFASPAMARGGHSGGGSHAGGGGHYAGGHGSSHKGGHFVNPRTGNHYGCRKKCGK